MSSELLQSFLRLRSVGYWGLGRGVSWSCCVFIYLYLICTFIMYCFESLYITVICSWYSKLPNTHPELYNPGKLWRKPNKVRPQRWEVQTTNRMSLKVSLTAITSHECWQVNVCNYWVRSCFGRSERENLHWPSQRRGGGKIYWLPAAGDFISGEAKSELVSAIHTHTHIHYTQTWLSASCLRLAEPL